MPTTADQPKCFAEIHGRRVLDCSLDALKENGIRDICFIGGYQIDVVKQHYPDLTFRHNRDWKNNNIMESLMYAEDLMDESFICSYSDTLFSANLIKLLLAHDRDIALSVDTSWKERYRHRSEHPADDAEKVLVSNGRVTRLHREIDPDEAHGEYTGIAKFSAAGARALRKHYAHCRRTHAGKPFREAAVFEKAYLIHLLQDMIEHGVAMDHVDSPGDYMEIDTQQDFELAQIHWNQETS